MSEHIHEVLPTQAPLAESIAAIVAAAQTATPTSAAASTVDDDALFPSQAPLSETIQRITAAAEASSASPAEVAAEVQASDAPTADEPAQALRTDEENTFEESVDELITETEDVDAAPVEAWDETVTETMAEMEDIAENEHIEHEHAHSDVVTLPYFGTFEVPGGIYTVVFVALALLTVIEVLAAETFPDTGVLLTFQIAILMLAAVAKSVLVVVFYMHLRTDNRLFRLVLALPLLVVLVSLLYLLTVPTTAGLGYQ